jgi:TPR repeat protein
MMKMRMFRAFLKCKPVQLAGAAGVAGMIYHSTIQDQPRSRMSRNNNIIDDRHCSSLHNKVPLFSPPLLSSSLRYYCNTTTAACEQIETEEQRFERILQYHRSRIHQYRKNWEYRADSVATTATKTPSRSWPDNIPSNDDLSFMLEDLKYCRRSPNFRSDKEYCHRLNFRVASALLMQYDEASQKEGMEILRGLAETGYPDAMAYYGICLNEGRAGLDPNPEAAVSWWQRSIDMYQHPQSVYELAVARYTGEGLVEDEVEAVRLFALAAEQDHPAAAYMLGDCLLDGIGVEMDRGAALVWLVRASELGHRGARSRVMAVLEKKEGEDYGDFTDASRQTFVHRTLFSADKDGRIIQRKTTVRKKIGGIIGGGPRNPTELQRRQTIVTKSRNT